MSDFCSTSSSSSSIGMNSDADDNDYNIKNNNNNNNNNNFNDDNDEVESEFKEPCPFDSAVDALEQALPIRRGLSNFYHGKSKSFASLSDTAQCSSIKDITKPENAYSRKRKRVLAYRLQYNKNKLTLLKSPGIEGGISKKSTTTGRSTLALGLAMTNCEGRIDNENINPRTSTPCRPVPPPPWRSFSLVDLQHCAASAGVYNSNLCSPMLGKGLNMIKYHD
ncbi:hypothetical protein vseg_005822 [Gypsophila vaccaria]